MVLFSRSAVFESNAIHHTAITRDLGSLRIGVNGHIVQALELVHQHSVCFELIGKLNDGNVGHNAGQIDGRFNA